MKLCQLGAHLLLKSCSRTPLGSSIYLCKFHCCAMRAVHLKLRLALPSGFCPAVHWMIWPFLTLHDFKKNQDLFCAEEMQPHIHCAKKTTKDTGSTMKYKRMQKQQLLSREVLKVAHDKQRHKFSPNLFLVKEAFLIFLGQTLLQLHFLHLLMEKLRAAQPR